jgi:CRP-like cAMP-binding protein
MSNIFLFAFAEEMTLPVSVVATADSSVLLIDSRRLVAPCAKACRFHGRLIQNTLQMVSKKNVLLTQKNLLISKRTTREKLLSYLSEESRKAGSRRFVIPFDRQGLADYLIVERSAMSSELSKLQKEGVLRFRKNASTSLTSSSNPGSSVSMSPDIFF